MKVINIIVGGMILIFLLIVFTSSLPKDDLKTLTIWVTYGPEELKVFRELCIPFEKAENIKTNIQAIPFGGHQSKLLTACSTSTTPDICRVDTGFLPRLAVGKAIHQLDTLDPPGIAKLEDDILKAAYDSGTIFDPKLGSGGETHVYGLPDQVTCVALFYNKDMFKAAGLDPERPPKTWDEFVVMGKKLTMDFDGDGGIDQYACAVDNSLWWTLPFFNSFNATFIKEDQLTCHLNEENAVAALQTKVDLYLKHKIEAGAWRAGAINKDTGFKNKKYAMVLSGPWNIKSYSDAGINYGVAMVPQGPAGTATNIGGTHMVIFKSCHKEKVQKALKFLKFVVSEDFQKKWCEELGQIPVNVNAKVNFAGKPALQVFSEQIKYAKARPKIPKYDMLEELINKEMEAALTGDKTCQEALDTAVKEIDKIVLSVLRE